MRAWPNKPAPGQRRSRLSLRFGQHGPGVAEFWRSAAMRVLAITLCVIAAGCDRGPSLANQIQAAGGFQALQRDCQLYFDRAQSPDAKAWVMGNTNDLPPSIAALRPQIVDADRRDLPMVDIQTCGGFNHRGLIVCLTNTPPDFRPASSWRVTKLADGVYEYRE